jgi:formate dehydrogenase subunit gamma
MAVGQGSAESDAATRERVRAVVAAHQGDRGALMPVLHGVQAEFGCIDDAVIPVIADELNLSRADVHGVMTFYRDFRRTPAGRVTVRLCRAEACQAVGSAALVAAVSARLGAGVGETSPDGAVTVEQVFCFGNCALGPAAEVAGELIGRATPDRLVALVETARRRDGQEQS